MALLCSNQTIQMANFERKEEELDQLIEESWKLIAPFWPLKNLIAVNPLQGLEELPIEEALLKGRAYFEQAALPGMMDRVNRETIKWLQVYFDEGQATIQMPSRTLGLFGSWRELAVFDRRLHKGEKDKIKWLQSLPASAYEALGECFKLLGIPQEKREEFLKLLLTTLPGWAGYIKQLGDKALEVDYLALRMITLYLLWPKGHELLNWGQKAVESAGSCKSVLEKIERAEVSHQTPLLMQLAKEPLAVDSRAHAQFVFCIDVRSEPFRRTLESLGDYQTFGFAGFFNVPIQITDAVTGDSYPSCPVLLSPKYTAEVGCQTERSWYKRIVGVKKLYQGVKYNFTTPFALVECLGPFSGLWMGLRTLAPIRANKLKERCKKLLYRKISNKLSIRDMSISERSYHAQRALEMMGLTENFAPLVVFCGHGSSTENNAYGSALDCGACGGRNGSCNANILASILNDGQVRDSLRKKGICIPNETLFVGAEHNTTTDELKIDPKYCTQKLWEDLQKAQKINSDKRLGLLEENRQARASIESRAVDWAQVRPEWGLARNSAFIVGPRALTQSLDLEGRCFLHSYDYTKDRSGESLRTILTAPMVVAQWINAQYLFSTLNNVSYGAGSKITKNITGKIGVMQGNGSDLMTGLPLQSVYSSDRRPYHEPTRLMTVIYAPCSKIDKIIKTESVLVKLFGNGWVHCVCIEPRNQTLFILQRDLKWKKMSVADPTLALQGSCTNSCTFTAGMV